ncbi:gfo/Idh/MocA family oxidoreductase [Verrucomicrobia bacterium LW23]|nr:gfo/Idh/MocA family oxidoreductase [Verrucomicrobia bacterium LW23]
MTPIRVGIIGFGRSGFGIHANAIASLRDRFTVTAVYDPLPERRSHEDFPDLKACDSVEELLRQEDVELVIVASPNKFHARHALAALRGGKHVLCEKPFGFTTADVDALIAASKASGKVLQAFQQRRYESDFQKVKEICESGVLGRITFIRTSWGGFGRRWDWQTARSFGGGQLYNNGPHPLDHMLELFGDAEPEVWCDLRRSLCSGDAEDEVQILLKAPNSPTIQIDLLATAAFPQERWYICGTRGGLTGGTDKLRWKFVDWSTMPARELDTNPTEGRSYNGEKLTWTEGEWTSAGAADAGAGATPASMPTFSLYQSLWATIREGAPQVITPESVRRRVAVLQKCYELTGIPFPEGTLTGDADATTTVPVPTSAIRSAATGAPEPSLAGQI